MTPEMLREILSGMTVREQVFAGAMGAVIEHVWRHDRAEISTEYLNALVRDVFDTVCKLVEMDGRDMLWLLQFLSAGSTTSATSSPTAAAPSPAGRGAEPDAPATPPEAGAPGDFVGSWPLGSLDLPIAPQHGL